MAAKPQQAGMPNMNNAGMGELWARLKFLFFAILVYRIGAHIMVNELFEDDEGFYKNHYQYATQNSDGSYTVHEQIPGTSSYTSTSDAIKAFTKYLKNK